MVLEKLFIIQLLASFFIGGVIISFFSFLAEKVDEKIAGIILSFPAMIALTFFFMGMTLSPEIVVDVIPSTLIPLGVSIFFVGIYPVFAEFFSQFIALKKGLQIFLTYLVSISLWFCLSVPLVLMKFKDFWLGVFGFFFLISVSYFLLNRKSYKKSPALKYSKSQKMIRTFCMCFVVFLGVLLSKVLNPFWGGLMAMLPIGFSSILLVIHINYGFENLYPIMRKVPIGSLSLFSYVITAMLTFSEYGYIWGTVLSYLSSLIVTLFLMFVGGKIKIKL